MSFHFKSYQKRRTAPFVPVLANRVGTTVIAEIDDILDSPLTLSFNGVRRGSGILPGQVTGLQTTDPMRPSSPGPTLQTIIAEDSLTPPSPPSDQKDTQSPPSEHKQNYLAVDSSPTGELSDETNMKSLIQRELERMQTETIIIEGDIEHSMPTVIMPETLSTFFMMIFVNWGKAFLKLHDLVEPWRAHTQCFTRCNCPESAQKFVSFISTTLYALIAITVIAPVIVLVLSPYVLMLPLASVIQAATIYYIKGVVDTSELTCGSSNLLELITIAIFSLSIFKDIKESFDMVVYIFSMPSVLHPKIPMKGKAPILNLSGRSKTDFGPNEGFHPVYKAFVLLFVVLPKLCIAGGLWYYGCGFLKTSSNDESLILNAVAIIFVLDIDDIIYDTFIPEDVKDDQSYPIISGGGIQIKGIYVSRMAETMLPHVSVGAVLCLSLIGWLVIMNVC